MSTRAGPAWPSKIVASGEVTRDPMQSTELDDHHVQIEQGGVLHMATAQDQAEMGQQLLMAIGISTVFSGALVHIDGWLPGLILKVQARRSVNRGEQISIEDIWPSMHARLAQWIDAPSDADALDLSFDGAHCLLIPDVFTWRIQPVAFTLKCVLPAAPRSHHP